MKKLKKNNTTEKSSEFLKMLSRRKRMLLGGIIAVIVIAAAGLAIYTSGRSDGADSSKKAEAETDPAESEGKEQDDNGEKEAGADSGTPDNNSSNGNSSSAGNAETGTAAQEGVYGMTLPYSITGSSLVIQSIASYDGSYIEDGSDSDISGVTVIVLENAGDTEVEYASISINRDGTELLFEASALPAGGTVVVQEKNKTLFQEGNYTDCSANVAEISEFGMSEDQVQVEETGDQEITVTNLTDETIPAVRIFYKFYMEDEDTYVGGITYTAKLTNLEAGASQTIMPAHYLKGSSKIMMVRTYDTAK